MFIIVLSSQKFRENVEILSLKVEKTEFLTLPQNNQFPQKSTFDTHSKKKSPFFSTYSIKNFKKIVEFSKMRATSNRLGIMGHPVFTLIRLNVYNLIFIAFFKIR